MQIEIHPSFRFHRDIGQSNLNRCIGDYIHNLLRKPIINLLRWAARSAGFDCLDFRITVDGAELLVYAARFGWLPRISKEHEIQSGSVIEITVVTIR